MMNKVKLTVCIPKTGKEGMFTNSDDVGKEAEEVPPWSKVVENKATGRRQS